MEIFGSMEDPEVRACVERLKSLGYNVIVVPDHQTKRKWILDDTQWLHIAENNMVLVFLAARPLASMYSEMRKSTSAAWQIC